MTNPKKYIFIMTMMFLCAMTRAQDFINTGTLTNVGVFQVKGHVSGLPDTIGGVFNYSGDDQTIYPSQYSSLVASGAGVKTIAENVSVDEFFTIHEDVTVRIDSPIVVTLQGSFVEEGILLGSIARRDSLAGEIFSSEFGGIGITITRTDVAPGLMSVMRTSGKSITMSNGNQGIARYYDITSEHDNDLDATFEFIYGRSELNGNDPLKLQLLRSLDNGATWKNMGGVPEVSKMTIVTRNLASLRGRWTLIDSSLAGLSDIRESKDFSSGFILEQNYPNPARASSLIRFTLPQSAYAVLIVSDVSGREVTRLVDGELPAGSYEKEFNTSSLASGIYRYRLTAGTLSEVRNMTVMK